MRAVLGRWKLGEETLSKESALLACSTIRAQNMLTVDQRKQSVESVIKVQHCTNSKWRLLMKYHLQTVPVYLI